MNNNEFIQMVDKAIDHLEAQGHPSVDAGGNCFYQYEDEAGNVSRCIVGWMIEDEATRNKADKCGETLSGLVDRNIWGRHLDDFQKIFLAILQEEHDSLPDKEGCFEDGIRDMRHALAKYSQDDYQFIQESF